MQQDNPSLEAPDIATSSEAYAQRFAGPVGQWFLQVQEQATLSLLREYAGGTLLDLGGGHGQLAGPLAEAGFAVTVQGSDASCCCRIQALVDEQRCSFQVSNLLALPFADRSFDIVIAYRLISHLGDWQRLLSEMARVARRVVLVEYPELASVNLFSAWTWSAKHALEGNTRPFTCFRRRQLAEVLSEHGFVPVDHYAEFLVPMVVHRISQRAGLSAWIEGAFRRIGLTQRLGSPVILKAVRK